MFTLLSGATRDPGHGTRNCKRKRAIGFSATVHSSIWLHDNPGHEHQKLQEEEGIYIVPAHSQLSPTLQSGATRDPGHGTKNARGIPLPVYINVHVYIFNF